MGFFQPTSMRAIRARYDPYLQTRHRVEQVHLFFCKKKKENYFNFLDWWAAKIKFIQFSAVQFSFLLNKWWVLSPLLRSLLCNTWFLIIIPKTTLFKCFSESWMWKSFSILFCFDQFPLYLQISKFSMNSVFSPSRF